MTIRKFLLITCIAGLAATLVSISHAEKASILDHAAATETQQATPQMCPTARSPVTRLPRAYKRYLNQTPISRFTTRHG
jgi:hypothetical protein